MREENSPVTVPFDSVGLLIDSTQNRNNSDINETQGVRSLLRRLPSYDNGIRITSGSNGHLKRVTNMRLESRRGCVCGHGVSPREGCDI